MTSIRKSNPHRPRAGATPAAALAVGLLVTLAGCEGSGPSHPTYPANLVMSATIAPRQQGPAAFVDAWSVRVTRGGGDVLAGESGAVGPGDAQVTLSVPLELETPCETLSIRIELSALGEVWYRVHDQHEVCTGEANTLPVQELEFVRPWPTIQPTSLGVTLRSGRTGSASFRLGYPGTGGVSWGASVDRGGSWLRLSTSGGDLSGDEPRDVGLEVDARNLSPGAYQGRVVVTALGYPGPVGTVEVVLTVTEPPSLAVEPGSLSFSTLTGTDPEPAALVVTNAGGGTLTWTASTDADWLVLAPASGVLGGGASAGVSVTVVGATATAGTHSGRITVSDPAALDSPRVVDVILEVRERAAIGLDRTSVPVAVPSGVDPPGETVLLDNPGGSVLDWTAVTDAAWLTVSPAAGTLDPGGAPTPLTLSMATASLPAGSYLGTVSISDPEASNSPRSVTVAVTIDPPVAPTLASLAATLRVLNDSTCANAGSRFDVTMDYSDPNGDVPVSNGRLQGTPLAFDWQFLPNGLSGSTAIDAATSGDGFAGTLTLDLCIAFQIPQNTGVRLTYRLRDTLNQWSLPSSLVLARPAGANVPPTGSSGRGDVTPGR